MQLSEWLSAEKGRTVAVAAHFGITPSAVSQWRTNGVPAANMKALRDFSNGAVSLEDMLPEPCRVFGAAAPAAQEAA